MDLVEKVRQLVSLMNENDLAELEVEEGEVRIKIKASASPHYAAPPLQAPAPVHAVAGPQAVAGLPPGEAGVQAAPPADKGLLEITSPMVGTFYRAPSDGAEPYVGVGTMLDPETVVCMVEAMKVMNEVKAEVSGEIVEILIQNAEPVEYGQVLFLVKPVDYEA